MNDPKHKEIFSGNSSNLDVHNIETGEKLRTIEMCGSKPHRANYALLTSENSILIGCSTKSYSRYLYEYDLEKNKSIRSFHLKNLNGDIWYLNKPKDRDLLVICSWCDKCSILKYSDFSEIAIVKHDSMVNCSSFVPSLGMVCSGSYDTTIRCYSLEQARVVNTIDFDAAVNCLEYSEARRSLLCLSGTSLTIFDERNIKSKSEKYHSIFRGKPIPSECTLYSHRVHDDNNLISLTGNDFWGTIDLRKPDILVHGGKDDKYGECWRQQKIGSELLSFGFRKGVEIRDWKTWKVKTQWSSHYDYTDILSYRGDQLSMKINVLQQQAIEDINERTSFIREEIDEFNSLEVIVGGLKIRFLKIMFI